MPVHIVLISAVERAGMHCLQECQKIAFDAVRDNRNGKMSAEQLAAA